MLAASYYADGNVRFRFTPDPALRPDPTTLTAITGVCNFKPAPGVVTIRCVEDHLTIAFP